MQSSPLPPQPAPRGPFAAIGAWVAERKRSVVACFAVLLAASGFVAAAASRHLPAGGFDVPGSDSYRVTELSEQRLGIGKPDLVLLYRRSDGGDMRSPQAAAD